MGDRAQGMALDAVENALNKNPRPHRHRVEHFGCDMGNRELRERAEALGIIPVVTIGWLYAYADFIEPYLGPLRRDQCFALRSMMETGLTIANSSDQCGTEPVTLDPFLSMWAAVTRQTYFGKRFVPEEAVSVEDALRLWTINAAYSGFEERIKGSIEPGKFADLIVISRDILTIPENEIKDIKVEMTIIDGEIVYRK
jgi:predicted amidohydrolase YtcJ